MMFCGEETYKKYKQQEAFLSWKEILGDDYSKYEEYMTDDGRLDLEKMSKLGEIQYGLLHGPLCGGDVQQQEPGKLY